MTFAVFGGPISGPIGGAGVRIVGGGTAPTLSGVPIIRGSGEVGEEHSVDGFVASGDPNPTIGYSWRVAGVEVATTPTYIPSSADADAVGFGFSSGFSSGFGGRPMLSVEISATNSAGSATPIEASAIFISQRPPALSATIDQQNPMLGDVLTITYSGVSPDNVTFQWTLDGSPISGAVSETLETDDAGIVTCIVTATISGVSTEIETEPVRVRHVALAGLVGEHAKTTASANFGSAPNEVSNQVFLTIVAYEGPAPTSVVIEGVTLSTFTDGANATTSGKTLTCLKGEVLDTNKRIYLLALEGLTGQSDVDFAITTPSNFSYLKPHCYQISGYSLENIGWHAATGSGSTLSVNMVKLVGGLGIAFANRMPSLSTTPAGWVGGFRTDEPASGWDVISGYIAGDAGYQGPVTFAQPNVIAGEQAVAVSLAGLGVALPELTSTPTITGGTAPTQGTAITLNIATASANTEKILVRVWRDTSTRQSASEALEYEVGSGDPAPTYTPTAGDVGFALVQSQTPVSADGVLGVPVFSAPTGVVTSVSGGTDPAQIASNKITFAGTPEVEGGIVVSGGVSVQRADTTLQTGVSQPAGWELCLLRTVASGVTAASGHPELQNMLPIATLMPTYDGSAAVLWRSGGGAADGVTQRLYAYWRHQATGRLIDAVALVSGDTPLSFVSDTPDEGGGVVIPPPVTNFPPANQTVSSATALLAAIDARIASGSSATWIIDLTSGNYGYMSFSGKLLPGETIIRSQNLAYGARFTGASGTNLRNIHFQFIDFNRQGLGYTTNLSEFYSAQNLKFSYNRITAPEINRDSLGIGYVERARYGIRIGHTTQLGRSTDILIHENLFSGPMGEPLYLDGVDRGVVSNNVAENVCGDFMMFGWNANIDVINNWGARLHYPSYDPNARQGAGDFYHSDMCQVWAPGGSQRIRYIGNVFIAGKHPTLGGITRQGILVQGQTSDFLFRNNLVVTNCYQGIWVEHSNQGGHRFENNTLLRIIDLPSSQGSVYYKLDAGTNPPTWLANVQQHINSWPGVFNIKGGGTDFTASRSYYTNPVAEVSSGVRSSFYDMRPVTGAITHWAYSGGTPIGCHQRFYDVIVGGQYPKIGAAGAAWKTWYDPRNQITS